MTVTVARSIPCLNSLKCVGEIWLKYRNDSAKTVMAVICANIISHKCVAISIKGKGNETCNKSGQIIIHNPMVIILRIFY